MTRLIIVLLLSYFTIGCSLAPFMSPYSGRSLGDSNWEITTNVLPTLGLSVARGFSDNFDAGLLIEQQLGVVTGAWGKYSFINEKEGASLALFGGLFRGTSLGTSTGYYIGPIFSYSSKRIEFYLSSRYNQVNWKLTNLTSDEEDDFLFDLIEQTSETQFTYLQSELGFNFWATQKFGLNLNLKLITIVDQGAVDSDSFTIPGFSLIFLL